MLAADVRYTANTVSMQEERGADDPARSSPTRSSRAPPAIGAISRTCRRATASTVGKSLAYDAWLYAQYEKMGLIEPKDEWLLRVLGNRHAPDPIRVLVVGSETGLFSDNLDGLPALRPSWASTSTSNMADTPSGSATQGPPRAPDRAGPCRFGGSQQGRIQDVDDLIVVAVEEVDRRPSGPSASCCRVRRNELNLLTETWTSCTRGALTFVLNVMVAVTDPMNEK